MILDHSERLQLPDNETSEHFDARMALDRLGEGLFWVYENVLEREKRARADATAGDVQVDVVGDIVYRQPIGLLSCAFQWYAVSACNYAQLVGWLVTRDVKAAKEYVDRVMPRLARYRNKVAAHFALTTPRKEDNEADLAASVMTQVIYAHGRLLAGALTPVLDRGGEETTVSRELSWCLTVEHEKLVPRYWPSGAPKAFQSLRVAPGQTLKLQVDLSVIDEIIGVTK